MARQSSTEKPGALMDQARRELDASIVTYRGKPVGTVAARDPEVASLHYDQVFTRDFAVSAVACLLDGKPEIVRSYLETTLQLQSRDKHMDCFRPGAGLMPASFKIEEDGEPDVEGRGQRIAADFGEKAIGRVAPVDASMWWLYMLRMYGRATGDLTLARCSEVQRGIRLILDLLLTSRFDMFPTLLVPDGSFMVDRRMGVYGHPMDIQALFFVALRSAHELLDDEGENRRYIEAIRERLGHLLYHIRRYYWLDRTHLTALYRGGVEGYGSRVRNPFNIYPDSLPLWLMDWLPETGGYFAGNLGPARIDCRWFAAGNLMAVLSSLADAGQSRAVVELIESRWDDLVGEMPVKVMFPALEGGSWRLYTGNDPKNTPWSYQNGAGWPFLPARRSRSAGIG